MNKTSQLWYEEHFTVATFWQRKKNMHDSNFVSLNSTQLKLGELHLYFSLTTVNNVENLVWWFLVLPLGHVR